jgi:hypothetical protein
MKLQDGARISSRSYTDDTPLTSTIADATIASNIEAVAIGRQQSLIPLSLSFDLFAYRFDAEVSRQYRFRHFQTGDAIVAWPGRYLSIR